MTLDDLINGIDEFLHNYRTFAKASVREIEGNVNDPESIIGSNVMQMRLGRRWNGENIGVYQNQEYAMSKRRNPSRYDLPQRNMMSVNLANTGRFYEGVHLVEYDWGFDFSSTDSKWENDIGNHQPLKGYWGHDVLGITEEYESETLVPHMQESLIKTLKAILLK